MGSIKDSLTFDDVSLIPQHSSIVPNETITSVDLFKNLKLNVALPVKSLKVIRGVAVISSSGNKIENELLDLEIERHIACSRAPDPTTNIFSLFIFKAGLPLRIKPAFFKTS